MDDIWDYIITLIEEKYYFQINGINSHFYKKITSHVNNDILILTSYDIGFFNYYTRGDYFENILLLVYNCITNGNTKLFKHLIYFIKNNKNDNTNILLDIILIKINSTICLNINDSLLEMKNYILK